MATEESYLQRMSDEIHPARSRAVRTDKQGGGAARSFPILQALRRMLPPVIAFIVFVGGWEIIVKLMGVPPYILPKPSDIIAARGRECTRPVGIRDYDHQRSGARVPA
ncbi:hypothetical protein LJK87_10760 [Paenibacillus sp. P25]|nr:hypothetical protein LJK87_10760 [Paenibacillus sp. P25]